MPKPLPATSPIPNIPDSLSYHAITLKKWSSTHPSIVGLCIGALIFRLSSSNPHTPQILLIKRAPTNRSFPNLWEIPGGSVEASDVTLLSATVREVWEETGLLVTEFKGQVWDNEGGVNGIGGEVEFLGGRGEKWCKLNFMVEVEKGEVSVNEKEHQGWGWFGRGIVGGLEMISEQAREIVENGFLGFERGVEGPSLSTGLQAAI